MGWGSGSRLMGEIIEAVEDTISDYDEKKAFFVRAIEVFEDADCDTLMECLGDSSAFDEAFYEVHPDWDDDEDEWFDDDDLDDEDLDDEDDEDL